MAKILIADDHAVVRMAVRLLLEKQGHNVVADVGSGIEVISQARELQPDLIILDIDMPHLDGFSVLQRLSKDDKDYKIVVFSGLQADSYALRCSRAGASAFASKDEDLAQLMAAVQMSLAGYTLFPATKHASVANNLTKASEPELIQALSPRELEVLRHLGRGLRIKEIAQALMLSEKTASTYKTRLISKLKVDNLIELADFAKRNGVI